MSRSRYSDRDLNIFSKKKRNKKVGDKDFCITNF